MAETEGFEPSVELSPHTRLAIEHLRPLGHVSTAIFERTAPGKPGKRKGGGGIRTLEGITLPVFKTGAFNRSATPPERNFYIIRFAKKGKNLD